MERQRVLRHFLGVFRIATHLHAEGKDSPLLAFEKIAECGSIPFARSQEQRILRLAAFAFMSHGEV